MNALKLVVLKLLATEGVILLLPLGLHINITPIVLSLKIPGINKYNAMWKNEYISYMNNSN